MERALKQATTCKAALAKFEDCRWGTSIDGYFASIVIPKCEQTFINSYSPEQKLRYEQEIRLCGYEYKRQQGTLYVSEAATCAAETAAKFAARPALANEPMPRASFNCSRAHSPLELAICSDPQLGQADIVLSRAYRPLYNYEKPAQRAALARNELQWLRSLTDKCHLSTGPASEAVRACLREQFELRFTAIDECAIGGDDAVSCLESPDAATGPRPPNTGQSASSDEKQNRRR
jgi:uncharacterized protein YecT (DUF1311 family)